MGFLGTTLWWGIITAGWIVGLLLGMVACMEVGRRLRRREPRGERDHSGVVETAVFTTFGLIVAFTFTRAAARYDERRMLILEETNAIGTAWLRLDLLPEPSRPQLKALMREYLDERLAVHEALPDIQAAQQHVRRTGELQTMLWQQARDASAAESRGWPPMLVMPALNAMFDIGTSRVVAVTVHVPEVIIAMLFALALLASLFVGYGEAPDKPRNWPNRLIFTLTAAVTIYVTLDLEYPRVGLITLESADRPLIELRKSMDAGG